MVGGGVLVIGRGEGGRRGIEEVYCCERRTLM